MTNITPILELLQETTPQGADAIYIVTGVDGLTGEDKYILVSDLLDSIQVVTIIDLDAAEAFVVQKDGGGQKVFIVDTIDEHIEIKGLVFLDGGSTIDIVRDEDDMASDDENALMTQQSGKKYMDDGLATKLADQTIGISDDNLLEVDGTVAVDDIMQATANGLKGLTYAELKALLNYIESLAGDASPELGGDLDALDKDIHNIKQVDFQDEHNDGDSGAADTIDWNEGNNHLSTMTDDCTYTFTAPAGPCHLQLKLIQGTGFPHNPAWPGTVKWPNSGTEPTWSTGDGEIDIIGFWWDGTNYWGSAAIDFG